MDCRLGVGFDPDAVPAGVGLTNMQDRIAGVGGRATIRSAPGRGTRIGATIPLIPAAGTSLGASGAAEACLALVV
jgi:signal transduction histidine kinase